MSKVFPFHFVNESSKLAPRYHDNDSCGLGRAIAPDDRRGDSGGYFRCERCVKLQGAMDADSLTLAMP
jgi:hypothetical protein